MEVPLGLEAVRVMCQETGCAQRYLGGDALAGLRQVTHQLGGEYPGRFEAYLDHVYKEDLTLGVAMTDGRGDRSKRPHQQPVLPGAGGRKSSRGETDANAPSSASASFQ